MTTKLPTKTGTETEYKQFLKDVELYALGLESAKAEIKREAYALAHEGRSSKVVREIKSNFVLEEAGPEYFDVKATFSLNIKVEDESLLEICSSFTAHFHSEKSRLVEKYAARFAESEARLIFWPYFRQFVSDTTARMHIRPLTIPLTLKT